MNDQALASAQVKANILIDALPYMQRHFGKIIVVKYGGNAMISEELKEAVIHDLILMQLVGMKPVVVHGGGPEINDLLSKLQIKSSFIDGLRVTDEATIGVVKMALMGKVNPDIVAHINRHGGKAIGFSGIDAELLQCRPLPNQPELGLVGEIQRVNAKLLLTNLDQGYIPVIAPIGCDGEGNFYNINADYAASKIAEALRAKRLMLLTDVPGIYRDAAHKDEIIPEISINEVPRLIEDGVVAGGMIPKIKCCVDALVAGVDGTNILNGCQLHSILLELFTKEGMGTMIVR